VGDRPDGEGLPRARSGDDAEAPAERALGRPQILFPESIREREQFGAVLLPEDRLDVQREGELDRLARRASGRDDDDPARRAGADECLVIGREVRVADAAERGVYDSGFSGGFLAGAAAGGWAGAGGAPAEGLCGPPKGAVRTRTPSRAPSRAPGAKPRGAGASPRPGPSFIRPPAPGATERDCIGDAISFFGSPKRTVAEGGALRIALVQSVGAGCCPAGTSRSHTRQRPAGGSADTGTTMVAAFSSLPFSCARAGRAQSDRTEQARPKTRTDGLIN